VIAAAVIIPLGWARSKVDIEFLPGVLVESFGFLMDVLFLGIFIVIFNSVTEKRRKIERYREEIFDYRGWNETEATYRIAGIIKRLNYLKVYNINLIEIFLESAKLGSLNLCDSKIFLSNLSSSVLINSNLSRSKLVEVDMNEAHLYCADFSFSEIYSSRLSMLNVDKASFYKSKLEKVEFCKSNLRYVNFMEAILSEVDFEDADLIDADFTNATVFMPRNLTYEQLCKVKSLYKCKGIPKDIEKRLVETHPHLFKNPESIDS
jgi:uncharacterized protein YjbI with pentapeptide repeats